MASIAHTFALGTIVYVYNSSQLWFYISFVYDDEFSVDENEFCDGHVMSILSLIF